MQIDKRSRAELKLYFVRNAIPTESNFAELIDAMLNQREDGITKPPNDALSVEAAGDDASQKKALNLYNSFSDATPTWVLSLNPRSDPANAATAKAGFSIGNAAGISRLFIDRNTGNMGLGTNDPKKRLHVQGASSGPFLTDTNDRPAIAITGYYPEVGLFSNVNNPNHGPTIRLGSFTDGSANTFKQWVIGTAGRNAAFLDIGFSDKSDPNPHAGIRNYNGKTILTCTETGRVGIGTLEPQKKLHLQGVTTGPFINDANDRPAVAITGHYPELGLFSNVANGNHGPTIRLGSFTDGNANTFKQWVIGTAGRNAAFLDIGFSDSGDPNPHAGIRNYNGKTILTFTETGRVGIGTTSPSTTLAIAATEGHLQLRRERTEAAGGKRLYLELYQDDPANVVPAVYPFIRFHHNMKFWHRLEAREDGLHVKTGDPNSDAYSAISAANLFAGAPFRIGAGKTPAGSTPWQVYGPNGIFVDVDTAGAGFVKTPLYVTALHGSSSHWSTTGGTSVYQPTATGFRIYVKWSDSSPLTPATANQNGWHIQWIGIDI